MDAGAPRALIRRNHYSIRFNPLPMAFNDEVPRTAPLRARAEDAAHESSGEALSWGPPEVAVAEAVVVAVVGWGGGGVGWEVGCGGGAHGQRERRARWRCGADDSSLARSLAAACSMTVMWRVRRT